MPWFILAASFILSWAVTVLLMPKPKPLPVLEAPRPRYVEPEPEFDPIAFWLFPDWDSGPTEEPFWMRPLKEPKRSNFGGFAEAPGKPVPMVWCSTVASREFYTDAATGEVVTHFRAT